MKVQEKKILRIKLKQVEARKSPRFVTPRAKKRSMETNPIEIPSSSRSSIYGKTVYYSLVSSN